MVLMLIAATMGVLVTTWLERKISAAAQQIGPDFMGPFGLLAPVADGLKLVLKMWFQLKPILCLLLDRSLL